jgi:hypothetical protein
MRRTALVSAICAIVTCWLAVAPATAATSHAARAAVTIKRLGRNCTTVHSNVRERPVVICVYVDINPTGKPRATVTFSARSGTLREVTITTLKFTVNGRTVRVTHNIRRFLASGGTAIADNWWDEPTSNMVRTGRSAAWNACAFWTDGGHACTGHHWLYSKPVPLNQITR